MTNSEKIRQFDDEQLARFLWIWKINSVTTFLIQGGMNSMNAKDMREWLDQTTDTFICTETFVGDDYTFDQDFKDKQADTPQTDCESCEHKHEMGLPCYHCPIAVDCGWGEVDEQAELEQE